MTVRRIVAAVVLTGSAVALGGGIATAGPPAVRQLSGTLHLDAGRCNHGKPTGSYLSVTFGTKAIRNSSSQCAGGSYTLLSPSQAGLLTAHYSAAATSVFDRKSLSLSTSSRSYFPPPRIYLVGQKVNADVRSIVVGYDGGAWPVGAEQATGSYDASSGAMSLQWFSGQSFTPSSAGTEVHIEGHFQGANKSLAPGTTVQLGTASFDAGPSSDSTTTTTPSSAGSTTHQSSSSGSSNHASGSHRRHRRGRLLADGSTTTGSPKMFLLAEVLVMINLVTFVAVAVRRGRK